MKKIRKFNIRLLRSRIVSTSTRTEIMSVLRTMAQVELSYKEAD